VRGMASVGVTSAVVNLAFKPLVRRRRPDRQGCSRSDDRGSGCRRLGRFHRAIRLLPLRSQLGWAGSSAGRDPLYALAAVVGYSRVQTGVHYPLDVIVGALAGITLGELTGACLDRVAHVQEPPGETAAGSYQSQGVSVPTSASSSR
jgi:undecaprenyl-diphosphatase